MKGGKGEIIWLGKYRILSILGEDSLGQGVPEGGHVFLAEHIRLHDKRIIKRIRKGHPFYSQLAWEAELLDTLNHPAIPFLFDVEEDNEYLYLIEEYIEGTSLKNLLLSEGKKKYQIIPILLQICMIIQYLHEQEPPVYYLDLKPEHLVWQNGKVRLLDFGAAIRGEKSSVPEDEKTPLKKSTSFVRQKLHFGTVGYAAPELFEKGKVGEKSDVYGIGCVAYFLLTGTVYTGKEGKLYPREKTIARELWKILKYCLHPSIQQRWSLKRVISSLEALEHTEKVGWAGMRAKKDRKKQTLPQGKRVIGVIGTHAGAGATFISLSLAFYLADYANKAVAWLEYNDHGACRHLPSSWLEGTVKFFGEANADTLAHTLNEGYEYYVIDFGCELEDAMEEYLRCGDKIIVSQRGEWRLWELERFHGMIKDVFRQDSWYYLYNLCPEGVGEQFHLPGISFPWERDIRKLSAFSRHIFERLFLQ